MGYDAAVEGAEAILNYITWGEFDRSNPHFERTPERFIDMLLELCTQASDDIKFTTFPNEGNFDEMVILQDIQFVSLCAHHLVPFIGVAHVAYIPNSKIVGLSKIPRLIRWCSRKPTVQEELTVEIADFLTNALEPKGVAVVMQAEHMCMSIRGVQARGVKTSTSAMRGVFLDTSKGARQEFLNLIAP